MKLFGRTLDGFAKAIVALVSILLVSSGVCGLSLGITSAGGQSSQGSPLNSLFLATGIASGVTLLVSVLGIALVLVAWLINAAIRNSSGPSNASGQPRFESHKDPQGPD
jgi:hypothetical protein